MHSEASSECSPRSHSPEPIRAFSGMLGGGDTMSSINYLHLSWGKQQCSSGAALRMKLKIIYYVYKELVLVRILHVIFPAWNGLGELLFAHISTCTFICRPTSGWCGCFKPGKQHEEIAPPPMHTPSPPNKNLVPVWLITALKKTYCEVSEWHSQPHVCFSS